MPTMVLISFCMLFLNLWVLVEECNADSGLDLNLFQQNDYHVKFERLELGSYNKDILKEAAIKTFKYNRTTTAINVTLTPKIDIEDIEGIVQAYKFMSNEYRHFPLRFQANTCKAINANVMGLRTMRNCGNINGCPFLKGVHYIGCNWYPDPSKLPPLIPDGQYKIAMQLFYSSQEMAVINLYGTVFRPFV